MRIVQVSAHYPPDFVSGGTLVPQRLSRGLQERGHDVRVFAGHVRGGRPALEQWDEVVDGTPVRWISVEPFTDWSAPTNFDNPAVTEAFTAWLTAQRPDVVHLHSLQALGAELVPAARDCGARVVVTMHDFWWLCGRQFLVTRDHVPCCLVVSCGVCPCQVDHAWVEDRDAQLRERLRAADLVLAPSRTAARVLVANGIDPARLRVDENGVPEPVATHTAPPRSDGPVRMLFTGGRDPMKGLPVLRRALDRLGDLPGWTLDAHGVPAAELERDGLPVQTLPPYAPHELGDVLARHDVLVLPSLMRESHSLVTREALAAGLAVICTDTLGPEEAVHHGVNGLVVPAGDDAVLADAMRRLVHEPDLLPELRRGGLLAPLRALDDQVLGLEKIYAELADTPPSHTEGGSDGDLPPLRRVLIAVGIGGASLRYRARLAAEGLALQGVTADVRHYRDPELPSLAAAADAFVLYRVPATQQVLAVVEAVRHRPEPIPLVFDIDDLIFDESVRAEVRGIAHLSAQEVELWWQGVRRYRTTMEVCDAYIGSTELLCEHAAEVTGMPVYRWANGVGRLLARASDAELRRPRREGPVRLGYFSGTDTHDHDWAAVEPAVLDVMARHPDVELWLGGYLNPTPALAPFDHRVHRMPFVPWHDLCGLLHDVDVNLAPLEMRGRFNEAKSAIKWLEAALVGTPTVASPTQPFREAVEHGVNGLLASTHDEWVEALDLLVRDLPTRRRLGARARRDALLELGPHVQGLRYLQILEQARAAVAQSGHRTPTSKFDAEALDEPWEPTALEPYAAPEPGGAPGLAPESRPTRRRMAQALQRLARLLRRALQVLRTEGPAAALAGSVRVARRLRRSAVARR